PGWPKTTTQSGDLLRGLLTVMGGQCSIGTDGLTVRGIGRIHGLDVYLSQASELTMVLVALAALADSLSRFTGIAHIRGHETDRLAALTRELTVLGADITELPDGLAIKPRPLKGAAFKTYDDHRMAHAAAVLGLAVPGVVLSDVGCTAKTMPNFPQLWTGMAGGAGGPARARRTPRMTYGSDRAGRRVLVPGSGRATRVPRTASWWPSTVVATRATWTAGRSSRCAPGSWAGAVSSSGTG